MSTISFYNKKICIIGNRDGPLIIHNLLKKSGIKTNLILINRKLDKKLEKKYKNLSKLKFLICKNEIDCLKIIKHNQINLIISIFPNIIFKKIHKIYPTYNFHLSYLPNYRGKHPIHWAILEGKKDFGITCHRIGSKIDHGPIIWQKKIILRKKYLDFKFVRKKLLEAIPENFFKKRYKQSNIPPLRIYLRKIKPLDSKILKSDLYDKEYLKRKINLFSTSKYPCYLIIKKKKYFIKSLLSLKNYNLKTTYDQKS